MIASFQEYFDTALAAWDGRYGWYDEALAVLCLVAFFNVAVHYFLQFLHKKYRRQHKVWQDSLVRAIDKPLCYYVWTIAAANIFQLIAKEIIGSSIISPEMMHEVLLFGGIFSIAWFLMRWKSNIIQLMMEKAKNHELVLEQNKIDLMGKLITLVIIFLTLLLILEVTGRNLNTLIAFGGIGGLAIAFASQEVIANFFSGFMIYITRPFAIDDWISLPERDIEGYVEEIGWYMTRIRTFEKKADLRPQFHLFPNRCRQPLAYEPPAI
jgi:MscS family membrane protein